ncbi:MAG: hypothetical protein ACK4NP_00925 [Parvularculaceae bacterium]
MSGALDAAAGVKARRAPALDAGVTACLALAAGVAILFALFPLGVAGDYANHLARTHIETALAGAGALSRYYELRSGLIPDLYMDAAAALLAPLVGVYAAGAIASALAVMAAPLSGLVLSRRLHGAAGGWLPAIGFAGVFSLNLEFGLINFIAASGIAILVFALWIGAAPGWRRALIFAPVALLLLAAHALGFLLFGFLVLVWELAGAASITGRDRVFALRRLFLVDAAAFAPALALLVFSIFSEGGGLRPVDAPTDFFASRLDVLLSMFRYYSDASAVVTAVASFAAAALGFGLGLGSGALAIDRRMAVVCAAVFALMMATPEHVAGIWGLHFRFGPAFLVLLAASVRFSPGARQAHGLGAGVLGGVLLLQLVHGGAKMAAADAFHDRLRADLATLPAGARLLQAFEPGMRLRLANHAGALAVIEADAFVPTLFTNTSPVRVRAEWRARHLPAGRLPDLDDLDTAAGAPAPAALNGQWSDAYFDAWPEAFTHVLYMRASGGALPALVRATPVLVRPDYVLYAAANNPAGAP